jgi:hypothetical protein
VHLGDLPVSEFTPEATKLVAGTAAAAAGGGEAEATKVKRGRYAGRDAESKNPTGTGYAGDADTDKARLLVPLLCQDVRDLVTLSHACNSSWRRCAVADVHCTPCHL